MEAFSGNPFGALDGEERVRQIARELRDQKLSLRAIASALRDRHLFPRRAKTWSPEMVRRLLVQVA